MNPPTLRDMYTDVIKLNKLDTYVQCCFWWGFIETIGFVVFYNNREELYYFRRLPGFNTKPINAT